MFLLFLWCIQYYVKVDTERHKKLLFETSEFAVILNNLPEVNVHYPIEQMKADLWELMERTVREETQ